MHNPGKSTTRCKPFESELTAVNQQTRADQCMSLACANIRDVEHDWFANLTELRETSYATTRGEIGRRGGRVGFRSQRGGLQHRISSVPMLAEVRSRVDVPARQRSAVRCLTGEARAMHADPELEGALFQVASQFNLLEMTGPHRIMERISRFQAQKRSTACPSPAPPLPPATADSAGDRKGTTARRCGGTLPLRSRRRNCRPAAG
jgi:hypothetical protein